MVGFQGESPADRRALEGAVAKAGSVASRSSREFGDSGDVQAMFKRVKSQERERAHSRVVLNCPFWTSPTGGWSNQIVRMGRSPTHVHGFLGPCPLVI